MRFVGHHVAHAASCGPASPHATSSVLVLDGRGEHTSHLAGRDREDGSPEVLARQELPHLLGCCTRSSPTTSACRRASDEYKVMAMASYGEPRSSRSCAVSSTHAATAASPPSPSTGSATPLGSPRATTGRAAMPTSPAPCSGVWRRSYWSSRRGCTSARANRRSRWPASRARTASPTCDCTRPGRSSTSGCSPRPGAAAPRSAPRCTSPHELGRSGVADADRGARPGLERRRADRLAGRRGDRVRAPRRPGRRCRRGARCRRRGRVVPGPGASSARARSVTAPARRPTARRDDRAAQRGQGPRDVPPGWR